MFFPLSLTFSNFTKCVMCSFLTYCLTPFISLGKFLTINSLNISSSFSSLAWDSSYTTLDISISLTFLSKDNLHHHSIICQARRSRSNQMELVDCWVFPFFIPTSTPSPPFSLPDPQFLFFILCFSLDFPSLLSSISPLAANVHLGIQ